MYCVCVCVCVWFWHRQSSRVSVHSVRPVKLCQVTDRQVSLQHTAHLYTLNTRIPQHTAPQDTSCTHTYLQTHTHTHTLLTYTHLIHAYPNTLLRKTHVHTHVYTHSHTHSHTHCSLIHTLNTHIPQHTAHLYTLNTHIPQHTAPQDTCTHTYLQTLTHTHLCTHSRCLNDRCVRIGSAR